jgi:hypothetical protein
MKWNVVWTLFLSTALQACPLAFWSSKTLTLHKDTSPETGQSSGGRQGGTKDDGDSDVSDSENNDVVIETPPPTIKEPADGSQVIDTFTLRGECATARGSVSVELDGTSIFTTDCVSGAFEQRIKVSGPDQSFALSVTQGGQSSSTLGFDHKTCSTEAIANANFPAGDGSAETPYLICSFAQLQLLRTVPTTGKYFVLGHDITEEDPTWPEGGVTTPILRCLSSADSCHATEGFQGDFDGQGHVIRGLVIRHQDEFQIGLFGALNQHARIHHLSLSDFDIAGAGYGGVVAGISSLSKVDHVEISKSFVAMAGEGGGLIGQFTGDVNALEELSYIQARGMELDGSGQVGGIVGKVQSSVHAHFVKFENGSISGDSTGGIVASLIGHGSKLSECAVSATSIAGQATTGGMIGFYDDSAGIIENVRSDVTASLDTWTSSLGGLIGHVEQIDSISNTITNATLSVTSLTPKYIGGAIGSMGIYAGTELMSGTANSISNNFVRATLNFEEGQGHVVGQFTSQTIAGSNWTNNYASFGDTIPCVGLSPFKSGCALLSGDVFPSSDSFLSTFTIGSWVNLSPSASLLFEQGFSPASVLFGLIPLN